MSDTPRMESVAGHAWGIVDAGILAEGMKLERELNAANERIKRLEEAGDAMEDLLGYGVTMLDEKRKALERWRAAKESKP